MSQQSILYIFRRPVTPALKKIKTRQVPRDIFYGFTEISKKYKVITTDVAFQSKLLLGAQQLLNMLILHFIDIGFSLLPTLCLFKELNKTDLIFATVDTYGLPIAFLKKMGLISKPLIFNTIGLYDGLIRKQNRLALRICQIIATTVDTFVSGGSFLECKKLATLLKIPLSKFTFIPFGIDTKFFIPKKIKEQNEILIIGADPSRDWELYKAVALKFYQEKFRIITYPGIVKITMPSNTLFEYNLPFTELRRRIWQAKFVIVLSKLNYHFAGQSTAMRAMSCGKPVIFTKSPGVEEYLFKNYVHCVMVPIGNIQAITKAVNWLNASSLRRQQISLNARRIIVKSYTIETYGKYLLGIFNQTLP